MYFFCRFVVEWPGGEELCGVESLPYFCEEVQVLFLRAPFVRSRPSGLVAVFRLLCASYVPLS